MTWIDALGWFGSALLVFSLLQARMLRLRVLNTIACLILIVFNAVLAVWPMVAMNAVLAIINVWFIVKMLRESDDTGAYTVLQVPDDDVYLRHFLQVHASDIATFFPRYAAGADTQRSALLVQHQVGVDGVPAVARLRAQHDAVVFPGVVRTGRVAIRAMALPTSSWTTSPLASGIWRPASTSSGPRTSCATRDFVESSPRPGWSSRTTRAWVSPLWASSGSSPCPETAMRHTPTGIW